MRGPDGTRGGHVFNLGHGILSFTPSTGDFLIGRFPERGGAQALG